MVCELCEHCQNPISKEDKITIREGFSYHKRCHKCYVCSETNLLNAEVFKGVIFCNSCAQRIFQGCSTARKTKTMLTGRGKRHRSKSHRHERERVRGHDRKPDPSRDGVIELARLVGSNTESDDPKEEKLKKPRKSALSDHAFKTETNQHEETVDSMKKNSAEMGTTTDVTQELLKSFVPEYEKPKHCTPPPVPQRKRQHTYKKKDKYKPVKTKPTWSDLRIAELGTSTEIASMALRKASEVPVTIPSEAQVKRNTCYTFSVVKTNSDETDEDEACADSRYSTIEELETSHLEYCSQVWNPKYNIYVNRLEGIQRKFLSMNVMNRRLGSILKMPLKLFKKHILNRSSLVSVLMSDKRSKSFASRLKRILNEDIVEHQVRGLERLYSTINRNNPPCRLGWVSLVTKVPRNSIYCSCSYEKKCKHFRHSHSYRCMRAQAMKLAGPTHSELAFFRNKVKSIIVPQFIRNILNTNNAPAIKLSAACQQSISIKAS